VPKESEKSVTGSAPGAFPETPATEPSSFSVDPIPGTAGSGNPVDLKPGEAVPDHSTFTDNTISSGVKDDEELKAADKAAGEQTFSVNPIPGTSGTGNPISLAPGESVPDHSTFTENTVQSNVKLDEASYNAADSAVAPPTSKSAEVNPQETGLFGVPPVSKSTIPESSLPVGSDAPGSRDDGPLAGILTSSAGAGTTTAALAGQVPKEPRGVPEVVSESQHTAHVDPEASANPVAVEEKKELESELKSKVPEEPATSTGGFSAATVTTALGAALASAGGLFAATHEKAKNVAADATTVVSGSKTEPVASDSSGVPEVVTESQHAAHVDPEASANPIAVEEKKEFESELKAKVHEEPPTSESGLSTGKIAGAVGGAAAGVTAGAGAIYAATSEKTKDLTSASSTVPDVVKESIAQADAPPEATTNPEAVREKDQVESELASKVQKTQEAGEPAPTIAASTSATAPAPTSESTTSGLNAPAAAPATTPATKENIKPETTATVPSTANGPTTTTGLVTDSTPAKSEAGPATPSKAKAAESTPATPAGATTAATPGSATTDKKKKRRSIFIQKIKKIFD
jgi:hypothetical protein